MQLPIQQYPSILAYIKEAIHPKHSLNTLIQKVTQPLHITREFDVFEIYAQMPSHQITHFIQKAVTHKKLVALQINETDYVASEVIGYLSLSKHSQHLILQTLDRKTAHMVLQDTIRHIRHIR